MKNLGIELIFMMLLLCSNVVAQNLNMQTKKIDQNQVPLSVQQSFEKTFGSLPADGYWVAQFTTETVGTRTIAIPEWYGFLTGKKKERAEARFSPDGKILFVKGFEIRSSENVPEKTPPGEV